MIVLSDARGNYGVSPKPVQYPDLPYGREVVDKAEVLALVREVLGLNQGELSKLVVDGKVTPVVVLNDYNFKRWVYKWKHDFGADFTNLGTGDFQYQIDNDGYIYCRAMINPAGFVCLDKNGNILQDVASYFNNISDVVFSSFSKYWLVWDDGNPTVFHIFSGGEEIFSRDTVLDYVDVVGYTYNYGMSKNGRYLVVNVNTVVSSWMMFYEGVA